MIFFLLVEDNKKSDFLLVFCQQIAFVSYIAFYHTFGIFDLLEDFQLYIWS